jgi:hypothetical protein
MQLIVAARAFKKRLVAEKRLWTLIISALLYFTICCQSRGNTLTTRQEKLAAELREQIDNYLATNFKASGFGGQAFCSHKVLNVEEQGGTIHEYIMALCEGYRYRQNDGQLSVVSGVMLPADILIRREGDVYIITGQRTPRDGAEHASDVRTIFPKEIQGEVFSTKNHDLLHPENERRARMYFRPSMQKQ